MSLCHVDIVSIFHVSVLSCLPCILYSSSVIRGMGWFGLATIRLRVGSRKQGFYIASVPMKHLVKLSEFSNRRWSLEDGWLVLEAF